MGLDAIFQYIWISFQVLLLDVLLSGSSAAVIASACRLLPHNKRYKIILLGAVAVILLRSLLTLITNLLFEIPLIKILGGVALLMIAVNLIAKEPHGSKNTCGNNQAVFSAAVTAIIIADLAMSFDNVVALAAVSDGNMASMILGLLMSIPLLMSGNETLSKLTKDMPEIVTLGGAMLGWFAGRLAISDHQIINLVGKQSPALFVFVPLMASVFVVVQGRKLKAEHQVISTIIQPNFKFRSLPFWVFRKRLAPLMTFLEVRPNTFQGNVLKIDSFEMGSARHDIRNKDVMQENRFSGLTSGIGEIDSHTPCVNQYTTTHQNSGARKSGMKIGLVLVGIVVLLVVLMSIVANNLATDFAPEAVHHNLIEVM